MCRLTAYIGEPALLSSVLTDPPHSLVRQSNDAREMEVKNNADGFGFGWYDSATDEKPCLQVYTDPAWRIQNLESLAGKVKGACIFGHARAASENYSSSLQNCHPFVHGRLMWMHNGKVGGFPKIKQAIAKILSPEAYGIVRGTTDSEHAFALYFQNLRSVSLDDMKKAMEETIACLNRLTKEAEIEEPSSYNFVVTDGSRIVASRYAQGNAHKTLYYKKTPKAVWIASEPLTQRSEWLKVPKNHIMTVDEERRIEFHEIH